MKLCRLISLCIVLPLAFSFSSSAGAGQIGIVLLHGKQDSPPYKIDFLAKRLEDKGYVVATPEMPWSRSRIYGATYEDAMLEIDKAANELRRGGVRKIMVGGLSLGANAALGYGARRDNVAGLIVLAPGHFPEVQRSREMFAPSVARTKEMIATGKGDKADYFDDLNMGRTFRIRARAKVYLSYFDPEGPAVVPANAAAIRSPIPILWVVGTKDPITRPRSYAFDKAQYHPKSKYIAVEAGHLETPTAAAEQVILWIETLGD